MVGHTVPLFGVIMGGRGVWSIMTTVFCCVASTKIFVTAIKAVAAWVVGLKRPLYGVIMGGKGAPAATAEETVAEVLVAEGAAAAGGAGAIIVAV